MTSLTKTRAPATRRPRADAGKESRVPNWDKDGTLSTGTRNET